VLTGIDVLVRDNSRRCRAFEWACHEPHRASIRAARTVDLLAKADGRDARRALQPEHGIAGKVDEKVGRREDEATGCRLQPLRRTALPTAEQLAGLDALVFDIQDVGCRFYTYTSTMGECLAAAATEKKKFFMLRSPEPDQRRRGRGARARRRVELRRMARRSRAHGMTLGRAGEDVQRRAQAWRGPHGDPVRGLVARAVVRRDARCRG
jgi:uncharacterized protein YbbC (DUF1343 family)